MRSYVDQAQAIDLSETAVVAVRYKRDRLVVEGEDAATYLQGQLSQNVEALAVGDSARSLLLQPQGKVDSWLRVYRAGDNAFWLDLETGHGEHALQRLERFKLRTKASLVLDTIDVLALRGPKSEQTAEQIDSVAVLDASWLSLDGVDLVGASEILPVDLAEADGEILELLRITAGLPIMGAELGPDTIPAAARIVDESVDFTKGCYVGQELVARIDSRGSATPKRLCRIVGSGPTLPAAGTPIIGPDEIELGELTSVVSGADNSVVGLAYIKRAVEVPCPGRVALPEGGNIDIEVSSLPSG